MTSKKLLSFYLGLAISVGCIQGCGGASENQSPLSPIASIGAQAFVDQTLSASGRQSCATCHAPETSHSAANALAVQLGGINLDIQGLRNSQTLRYLVKNTPFHFDEEGTPTGVSFGTVELIHLLKRLQVHCWVQKKWPSQTKFLPM